MQRNFIFRGGAFQIPWPRRKQIFLDSLTQTKKNIFRFLDPNKKKNFLDSTTRTRHFHDQILAVFFSWSIVQRSRKQVMEIRQNVLELETILSFIETKKKNIFQIPQPKNKINKMHHLQIKFLCISFFVFRYVSNTYFPNLFAKNHFIEKSPGQRSDFCSRKMFVKNPCKIFLIELKISF